MSELHALLIGVDDYIPDRLSDGTRYPSLQGASRDVRRMALLLRDLAGLTVERTRLLVSRKGADGLPEEPPERRPTYANLVAAFRQLADEARPGDRVYVHYSGHGARMPTEYPEVKGKLGQDEALVPCDIGEAGEPGEPGSRYLRDLELATLVQLLVERQLLVTLVLDCCHAGGALRSRRRKVAVRRVPWACLDPVPSAVADREVLLDVWRDLQGEGPRLRGLSLQGGWLPASPRYVLFAACRPDELAFEVPFDRGEPQGALTYWLHDTLGRFGPRQTCGEIHQRLLAQIRGRLVSQTPMLLGDGDRLFLEDARGRSVTRAPAVLRAQGSRALLGVGQSTGARVGERYRVPGAAVLEIQRVGATESWAEIVEVLGPQEIEPGAGAEILPLQVAVHLVPPEPGNRVAERALARLRDALRSAPGGFTEVDEDGSKADLLVAIDERGAYEILDPGGNPIPNLRPLLATSPTSCQEVVRRLDHLAKFRNILMVENPHPSALLRIGLEVRRSDPRHSPLPPAGRSIDLKVGDEITLRIANLSTRRLDFTVLDLAPDYGVKQLLPPPGDSCLLQLEAEEAKTVGLTAWLPPGIDEGTDVLKIFATLGAVRFGWLEQPPLTAPATAPGVRTVPKHPLERLFAKLAAVRPARRSLTPSEFPEDEWLTAQLAVRIRR